MSAPPTSPSSNRLPSLGDSQTKITPKPRRPRKVPDFSRLPGTNPGLAQFQKEHQMGMNSSHSSDIHSPFAVPNRPVTHKKDSRRSRSLQDLSTSSESLNLDSKTQFPDIPGSHTSQVKDNLTESTTRTDQGHEQTVSNVDMLSEDGQDYYSDGAPANDADIDSDSWIPPTKTAKLRNNKGAAASVSTQNRFDPLSQNDEEDDDDNTASQKVTNGKKSKPPPIYVYGVNNKYQFSRTLASVCRTKPKISHTQQYVRFHTESYADYEKLKTFCSQQKYQFATEVPKPERPFKVVLRKLPIDTPTKDILDDLKDLDFPALEVSQLYGRDKETREKVPHPLFLATLQKRDDNHRIYKLEYLLSYRVAVEPYRPPELLQCFKCQKVGHSMRTCFCDPKCVKCGAAHLSSTCLKTRDTPAHCANCNGDHPANYRGCSVLKNAIAQRRASKKTDPETSVNTKIASTSKADTTNAANTINNSQKSTYANPQSNKNSIPTAKGKTKTATVNQEPQNTSNTDSASTSFSEMGATIREVFHVIKDVFSGLNITRIFTRIQQGLTRIRSAEDKYSKIAIIVEIIFSALDDGSE